VQDHYDGNNGWQRERNVCEHKYELHPKLRKMLAPESPDERFGAFFA